MEDIIAKYNLNREEEKQFRLNLENPSYAAFALAAARTVDDSFLVFAVKALLARDPTAIDAPVASPLGYSMRPVVCWLAEDYPYLMPLAVAAGAQVNQFCLVKWTHTTLLGRAALEGSHELAAKLMDLGADPNFIPEGSCMSCPLEIAVREQDRTMVELLLDHGANPNYPNQRRRACPLLLALENQDISLVHLLFFHGADWRQCDLSRVIRLPLERFKWFVQESGYSPLALFDEGPSLLMLVHRAKRTFAWHGGYEARVKILLDAGAV